MLEEKNMKCLNWKLCMIIFAHLFFNSAFALGQTVFTDDFSGGLWNWTAGTKANVNPEHDVQLVSGEVSFIQGYDYIETNNSYGDVFEISFQVRRTGGSSGNFDFLVEVVEAPEFSGLVQLVYGSQNAYEINVGSAPSPGSDSDYGDDVDDDTGYHQALTASGIPYTGTVTYTWVKGYMKFAFTHDTLGTIETPWIDTGVSFSTSTIRIWAMGSGSETGTRFIDNVTVDIPPAKWPVMGQTVFTDNFSGGLGNWTLGTKANVNPEGHDVQLVSGEVSFIQGYDYIETNDSYGDAFEISFEVRRIGGSSGNFDFLVEVVEAPEFSGLVQLVYGAQNAYEINVGSAPSPGSDSDYGDDVDDDTGYHQALTASGIPYTGTVTYTWVKGYMKFAFTHDTLGTIETPWIDTGVSFSTSTIRIWAMGSGSETGTRFLDNVTIDLQGAEAAESNHIQGALLLLLN